MGNLDCLDAQGRQLAWKKDFTSDYGAKVPTWGFAGHPLVDGNKLICLVGGKDATVVAFDKDTGKEIWRALDAAEPGYCPPTHHRGRRQAATDLWHGEGHHVARPGDGQASTGRST